MLCARLPRFLLVTAILALLLSTGVNSAEIEVGGVGFDVTLGFAGHFRPNTWVPVQVRITNAGVPFDARVEVVSSIGASLLSEPTHIIYRRPVSLPSGTHKQLLLTLPITSTYQPLDVRLVETNGNILQSERIPLRDAAVTADIVLVLDTTGERWTWLQEVIQPSATLRRTRVYVAHAQSADELPSEWVSYESVRTIVLTDTFPVAALSAAQIRAITQWVQSGGHLLVVGGPALDATTAPELAALLPVTLTGGSQTVTLRNLTSDAAPLPAPLQTIAWNTRPGTGRIDLAANGMPLIAHQWVGAGRVTYLGFDLSARSLRNWSGLDAFSRSLVFPPRMVRHSTISLERSLLPLLNGQKVPYPRHFWLAIFMLFYICAIALSLSVAQYRRLGWLLLLITTMVSSGYVQLMVKPQARQALRAYGEIRISQVPPSGGPSYSVALAQMVNMQGGDWLIQPDSGVQLAPASTLLADLDSVLVLEQTDAQIRLGPAKARQALAITSQSFTDIPLQVSVARQSDSLQLKIANNSAWPVRSAFFVDRDRYVYIGDVPAGETAESSFPADQFIIATDTLSPDWIAASVASVAKEQAIRPDKRETDALRFIVSHALTPGRDTMEPPWGTPLLVALIDTPISPPFAQSFTGVGYHFIVCPLSSLWEDE